MWCRAAEEAVWRVSLVVLAAHYLPPCRASLPKLPSLILDLPSSMLEHVGREVGEEDEGASTASRAVASQDGKLLSLLLDTLEVSKCLPSASTARNGMRGDSARCCSGLSGGGELVRSHTVS